MQFLKRLFGRPSPTPVTVTDAKTQALTTCATAIDNAQPITPAPEPALSSKAETVDNRAARPRSFTDEERRAIRARNNMPVSDLDLPKVVSNARITYPAPPPTSRPGQSIAMTYAAAGHEAALRRVKFLIGSPGQMLTGIDLSKRKLRTYHLDRIEAVYDERGRAVCDSLAYIVAGSPIIERDLSEFGSDRAVALKMRKEMLAALSLLVLIAEANRPMTKLAHKAIMDYVVRDNRFAVREGWVPTGDKRAVWPILSDMVLAMRPDAADIAPYVRSLNHDWQSPRRFEVFCEAISIVANVDGPPTPEQMALGRAINLASEE